jgi:hypothetical protein
MPDVMAVPAHSCGCGISRKRINISGIHKMRMVLQENFRYLYHGYFIADIDFIIAFEQRKSFYIYHSPVRYNAGSKNSPNSCK